MLKWFSPKITNKLPCLVRTDKRQFYLKLYLLNYFYFYIKLILLTNADCIFFIMYNYYIVNNI